MNLSHSRHLFIDGAWQAPATPRRFAVVNPATEEVLGELSLGSADDAACAVLAARRAFGAFSQTPLAARVALLRRIHALILARSDAFADALTAEMGAAQSNLRATQVHFALEHLRIAAEAAETYPFLTRRGTTATVKEPIGVAALITPWNWPLYQITAKLAPALATGCTVVLKPSELSPLSALLFAEVMEAAGTPPGVFNLVTGTGEEVGAALASHPQVDMVSITGSTRAGVLVAQAAAVTVKRVVQELGGKSPNILLPDADFPQAVAKGVLAGMRNVGQSCSAPTRMIVPHARLAEVETLAAEAVAAIRVGDPHDPATTMGPIANAAQYQRVQAMIQAGLDEGARLVCGGLGRPEGLTRGFFARPTVFSDTHPAMRIVREEIFGPVLVIQPYDDLDQALHLANDTPYGLGAHVHGADLTQARRVAARIRAGQVHINAPIWDGWAAFGGFKQSGNGREYGVSGLEEYLETKSILGFGEDN
jgi:aldehyde dehydrogenase (NAD+)